MPVKSPGAVSRRSSARLNKSCSAGVFRFARISNFTDKQDAVSRIAGASASSNRYQAIQNRSEKEGP